MNKYVKGLLIFVCAALILVFVYSSYKLASTYHQYHEAERYYTEQAGKYAGSAEPAPTPPPSSERPELPAETEEPREVSPRTVDFPALTAECPDVRAWLYGPDTVIDYPVVQSIDNDYYLHRFMDGSYNTSGTLFMDFRCPGDFTGKHIVIYGHHMQNGSMLASLVEYQNQEYYDAHPILYLNTPNGDYKLEVFSAFVTWYDSRVYLFGFSDEQEFVDWYTLLQSYSDFQSDVELHPEDRIVTLSTCTYDYDNARYVVMARLVPLG